MASNTLPKRALIAFTSEFTDKFYANGDTTGLYYTEVSHPIAVFHELGYAVDFVSETGKAGFDPHSVAAPALNEEELKAYNSYSDKFALRDAVENSRIQKASEVDSSDYSVFFAAGGHGACYDFPKASGLHKIADEIYQRGGVVSAVCHGPLIFANLKNSTTGEYLIKDHKVTGFTDEGEDIIGVTESMKARNFKTCKTVAEEQGGVYVSPKGPWDDFSIADGRIVTGANPFSAHSSAKLAVETVEKNRK